MQGRGGWVVAASMMLVGLALMACGSGPASAPQPTDPVPTATPSSVPAAAPAVQAAVAEAAKAQGVEPGRVQVMAVQAMEWPDAAMGCPQPGQMYSQVITPGWRIQLSAGGQALTYHANSSGSVVVTCARP